MAKGSKPASGEPNKKEKDSEVIGATLSMVTIRRMDILVDDGAYGTCRPDVIRHFLEEGLRRARSEGLISIEAWHAAASSPSTGG